MGEAQPRRSVRATKGQHTKSFDEFEHLPGPKRRQTRKKRKIEVTTSQETSQEPDEVIRCVCGATEQNDNSGEAWISCETCFVWQHNVCVGISSYEDEIPDNYWCEQCRPENHRNLLAAQMTGNRPWERHRATFAPEESDRRRSKCGRKGRSKGSRPSDTKEDFPEVGSFDNRAGTPSITDDSISFKKFTPKSPVKGKFREVSRDLDAMIFNLRRLPEHNIDKPFKVTEMVSTGIPTTISDLPDLRIGPARALKKSILYIINTMKESKSQLFPTLSTDELAEKFALQVERAVLDAYPSTKGYRDYCQQIKSLTFNLKNNPELCEGLLDGLHSPDELAMMTSEQLASTEMQRQTAQMRARAEKQSILYTQEFGPRVHRTHKGEEILDEDTVAEANPLVKDPHKEYRNNTIGTLIVTSRVRGKFSSGDTETGEHICTIPEHLQQQQQQSPSQVQFDIKKVFSTVKFPPVSHRKMLLAPSIKTQSPGEDADVDRLLEEDNDSPPYSPTEEAHDPDIVWRGSLAMSSIADFQATAKHVGGANFSAFGPWSKLMPKRMAVAGRIAQQSAIEYLCGLRYSNVTDIVVVSLRPAHSGVHQDFLNLIEYFISKNRYGVVGNKVAGNVRDTYLVPVPAGEGGHPEFMLNLVDNFIPRTRSDPMLLAVFVYRSEPSLFLQLQEPLSSEQAKSFAISPPLEVKDVNSLGRRASGSAPSPTSLIRALNPLQTSGALRSLTPNTSARSMGIDTTNLPSLTTAARGSSLPIQARVTLLEVNRLQAQKDGQATAKEVLGPLVNVPTVQFLLPQAFQMSRREWEIIKAIYQRDARARDDLQHLGVLLEREGSLGVEEQANTVSTIL